MVALYFTGNLDPIVALACDVCVVVDHGMDAVPSFL